MHIGLAPGLAGAVAILAPHGALVAVEDTPVLILSTSRGTRQEYDLPGLVALLAPFAGPGTHVTLEESQAMPGQGVRSEDEKTPGRPTTRWFAGKPAPAHKAHKAHKGTEALDRARDGQTHTPCA